MSDRKECPCFECAQEEHFIFKNRQIIKKLETELAELRERCEAYEDALENIVEGKCRKSGLIYGTWQMEQTAEKLLEKWKGKG